MLCACPHYPVLEYFHLPEKPQLPISSFFQSPAPTPDNFKSAFCFHRFTCSRHFTLKESQHAVFWDWLLSQSKILSKFIPIVAWISTSFFSWSNNIALCGYITFYLFIHSCVHRHLGSFCVLVITNNVASTVCSKFNNTL